MISLRESLLNNTKDKLSDIHDTIKKVGTFGGQFHLETIQNMSNKNCTCISAKGVEKLTKGMDITDDRLARGSFGGYGNKVRNLINLILHIDLVEWGFVNPDWSDRGVRKEFGVKLNDYLTENGAFNDGDCWVNMESFGPAYPDTIILMFSKDLSRPVRNIPHFAVHFKLNK